MEIRKWKPEVPNSKSDVWLAIFDFRVSIFEFRLSSFGLLQHSDS